MIKIKFTEEQLMQFDPCSEGLEFARSLNFDFNKIYDTCEKGDWMIWLLRKSNSINRIQAVNLTIVCAEHVLPIFEKKYPNDNRPRKVIEAAQAWLLNPIEGTHRATTDYADFIVNAAAYAAVNDAAYAAYAAATAADFIVNTTAYAAYAINAAAYAAAYAVNDAVNNAVNARTAESKWQANKIRELIPNPFK